MLMRLLAENKADILKNWRRSIWETYPPDGGRFFESEKDRFKNPVGQTISQSVETLLDEITGEMNTDRIASSLDDILRIRAVQDFLPARAVGFIFSLKKIVRDFLGDQVKENRIEGELLEFESKIDTTALLAFNKFMECREKVYEIKANEIRNRSIKLLERINSRREERERKEESSTNRIQKQSMKEGNGK